MTAAHCGTTYPMEGSQVSVGAYFTGTPEGGAQSRFCTEWISHPKFNPGVDPKFDFDIALCKLDRPVDIDESMGVFVLDTVVAGPVEGEDLTLLGTGKTSTTVSEFSFYSEYLKEITVPVWNQTTCEAKYLIDFSNNMLCAGSDQGDACLGDSGAPLIRSEQNVDGTIHTVVGVVSYGYRPCGTQDFPTVYARVGPRAEWIEDTICQVLGSSDSSMCSGATPYDDSCAVGETRVVIGLQPDKKPFETIWNLQDESNAIIERRGPFVMRDKMSESVLCLENGQTFDLTIVDDGNDGITGEDVSQDVDDVVFSVYVGGEPVISSHGMFGGSVTVSFSTPLTGAPTATPTATPTTAAPTRAPISVPEQCRDDIMLVHESGATPLPTGAVEIIGTDESLGTIRVKVNSVFPGSSNIANFYYQYAESFLNIECYEEQNLASGDYFIVDIKCTEGTKIALLEMWLADQSLSGEASIPNCCHPTVPENTPVVKYMLEFSCVSKCSGVVE